MTEDIAPPVTTDDAGIPAPSDEFSLSGGVDGPLLLQDHYVIQKMAHFNRERVDRVPGIEAVVGDGC